MSSDLGDGPPFKNGDLGVGVVSLPGFLATKNTTYSVSQTSFFQSMRDENGSSFSRSRFIRTQE